MKVGPYEVLRKLGEGAYGKVYLARKGDPSGFVTWYALKRISRGQGRGENFESYLQREAQVGGLVNHPSLVRVHEVLSLPREWVLVQDFVDGVTLSSVLADCKARGEPVPWEAALELTAQLLESLDYLHTLRDPEGREQGFVHRDVKPGNVMLTAGHGIRVMDFGVARGDDAHAGTLAGELRGTLAYMAPEQATAGDVGPATDQFAAGLILIEMLSNASPWGDVSGAAVLGRVVTGDVSRGLEHLVHEEGLQPILQRMLARVPGQRYETAADAADALRHLRAETATPPALRKFCIDAVQRHRSKGDEDLDDEPSWTGSFRWTSADSSLPVLSDEDSLGTGGLTLSTPDGVPVASASAADGGGSGLLEAIDSHRTLPLETSPAQRAALLAAMGQPAPTGELRIGTGETVAEAQARLGDIDPAQTLPIPDDAAANGEPARAGAHPAPPASKGKPGAGKRGKTRAPASRRTARRVPQASVGGQLWAQFLKSPLLGTLLLLAALLLIAATTRLAWMALLPSDEPPPTGFEDEELMLPSDRLAGKQARERAVAAPSPSVQPGPAPAVEVAQPTEETLLQAEAEPVAELGVDPGSPPDEAPPDQADVADLSAEVNEVQPSVPPSDPTPRVVTQGGGIDADLADWRGETEGTPTPEPRLQEGQIISGSGAGESLLSEAEGERSIDTRRQDGDPEEAASPVADTGAPRLRFLSSDEQPVGAPLSVRVRSDGFYATSVAVYYQWRSEGAAARKRRSLSQQSDGSFALEIPASELHSDRLQLWFTAEPGGVPLGDAGNPLEVKVR